MKPEIETIHIQNPFLPDDKMIVPYPTEEDCISAGRMIAWAEQYCLTSNEFNSAKRFSAVFRQAVDEWNQPQLLKACIDLNLLGSDKLDIFYSFFDDRTNKCRKLQALFQWLEEDKNDDWKSLFKQLVLISYPQGRKNLLQLIYEWRDTFLYRKIHCILGFSRNQIETHFVSQGIYPKSRPPIPVPEPGSLSGNLLETDHKTESKITLVQNPFVPADKMLLPAPAGEDIQVVYRMIDWLDRYRLTNKKFNSAEDFFGVFRQAVSEWNRPQLLKAFIDQYLLPEIKGKNIFNSFFLRNKYQKSEALFQWLEEDKNDDWKNLFKQLVLISLPGRKTLLQISYERRDVFLLGKIHGILGFSRDQIKAYFVSQGIYENSVIYNNSTSRPRLPVPEQRSLSGNLLETDHKTESKTTLIQNPFAPDDKMILPEPTEEDRIEASRMISWVKQYDLTSNKFSSAENFSEVFRQAVSEWNQQQLLKACIDRHLVPGMKATNIFNSFCGKNKYQKLQALFQWLEEDKTDAWKRLFKQLVLIPTGKNNRTLLQRAHERNSTFLKAKIEGVLGLSGDQMRDYFIAQGIYDKNTKHNLEKESRNLPADCKRDSREEDRGKKDAKIPGQSQNSPTINSEGSFITQNEDSPSRPLIAVPEQHSLSGNLLETDHKTESKITLIQNPFTPDDKMTVPEPTEEDRIGAFRMINWVKQNGLTSDKFSSAENFSGVFRQAVSEWNQPQLLKACIDLNLLRLNKLDIFHSFCNCRTNKYKKLEILFRWLEEDKTDAWKRLFKLLVLIPSGKSDKTLLQLAYERNVDFLLQKIYCILGFSRNQIKAYFVSQGIYDKSNKGGKKNATPEVAMIPGQSQNSPTINSERSSITPNEDSPSRQLIPVLGQRSLSGNLSETDHKTESKTIVIQNPFVPEDKMIVSEPTGEDLKVVCRMRDWVDRYRLTSDKFSSAEDFSGFFRRAVNEWNQQQLLKACIDQCLIPGMKATNIFNSFSRNNKYQKLQALFQWLEEDKSNDWKSLFKQLIFIPSLRGKKKSLLQLTYERMVSFLYQKICGILGLSKNQIQAYFVSQGIYDQSTSCQHIPVPEQRSLSGNLLETDHKTESKTTLVQNPFVPEDKMIVPEPTGEDLKVVCRMRDWVDRYRLTSDKFSSAEDFSGVFRRAASEWNQQQLLKACIDQYFFPGMKATNIFISFSRNNKYQKLRALFQWLEEDKSDDWKSLFKQLVFIPSLRGKKKSLLQLIYERMVSFLYQKICDILGLSKNQIQAYFVSQGIYDQSTSCQHIPVPEQRSLSGNLLETDHKTESKTTLIQNPPMAGFNISPGQEQPSLLNSFDHPGSTPDISGNLLPEQKKRHRSGEVSPGNSYKRVRVEESKLYNPNFFSLNRVTSGSPNRRITYPGAEELYHPVTPPEWKKYIKLIRTTQSGTISTAQNNCDPLAVALAKGILTGKFSPADSRVNKHNRLIYQGQPRMRSIQDKQGNERQYLTYIDTNIAYGQGMESRLNRHVALTGNPLFDHRLTPDNPKESRLVAGNFNEQGFDPIIVEAADLLSRLVKIARDQGGWVYATLGFNRCVPFFEEEREQAEEKLQEKLGHLCGVYVVDEKFNEKYGSPLHTEDKRDKRNELVTFLEPQACYEDSDEEWVVHKLEEIASIIKKGDDLNQDLFDSKITILIINSHNIMEARAKQNQRPKQEEATPICQLRGF